LRAEQAKQTRSRVVAAAVELLSERDLGDLSMYEVAARAGVSVRTVYRSFATKDELLDGVIQWITEHIDAQAGPPPVLREDFESGTAAVMTAMFGLEPLYRALFATAAGRESHRRTAPLRQEIVQRAFADAMSDLDADQARRLGALLHLAASSHGALFMKDYWDLSPEAVGRAAQWAMRVLADAASDPEQRNGL
jgi:AcrR family transcriptional regulator